jgi:hypothetical protein
LKPRKNVLSLLGGGGGKATTVEVSVDEGFLVFPVSVGRPRR